MLAYNRDLDDTPLIDRITEMQRNTKPSTKTGKPTIHWQGHLIRGDDETNFLCSSSGNIGT